MSRVSVVALLFSLFIILPTEAILVRGPVITAFNSGRISLKDASCGSLSIITDESTKFSSNGLALAAPNDVEINVGAAADCSKASTFPASSILVLPQKTVAVPLLETGVVARLNMGGPACTDPAGLNWAAETGFTGGAVSTTTSAISGTSKPVLYQSARSGLTAVSFIVPSAGLYVLNLRFVELSWDAAGKRVFDVLANNIALLSNFDIYARVGKFAAVNLEYTVNITGTRLDVTFVKRVDQPTISAIAVSSKPLVTTTAAPLTTAAPTTNAPTTAAPTTTAAPSTTPPPTTTKVSGRDALVPQYGKYIPQPGLAANHVGITVPISQLTAYNSPSTNDFPITSPITFTNQIVYGRLKISGAGKITAKNCWFAGPPSNPGPAGTGETAILDFDSAGTSGSTFVDCTIAPRFPHPRLNAFKGSRHRVERCHMFWVTDGLGPYTGGGNTFATEVEVVASRVERLVYWPGMYYVDRNPFLWNGTTWPDGGIAGKVVRSLADKNIADMIDNGHNDGNHNDCIQIHNAFGSHTFNTTTKRWTGTGIHIWGNALIADDAYGQTDDPSGAGIPVPGQAGSVTGSRLGWGDNPKRGLVAGGQKPGMAMPQTSWTNPVSTNPTKYAGGVSLYIGQVTKVQFESVTSVVVHDNYINGGNMGMQEKKTLDTIAFHFYDNKFGPDYFMWSTGRNIYPVRINDFVTANTMPNWSTGPVRIPPHPVTGAPPFGTGGSNVWVDPANKWSQNGQPLVVGSSTVAGIRVT